jgi:uncharacterized membrane protein
MSGTGGNERNSSFFPFDLLLVVLLVVISVAFALAPVLRNTPLRILFGLIFVLFTPGYALVAALFPQTDLPGDRRTIDHLERIALSFGTSLAVTAIAGLLVRITVGTSLIVNLLVLCGFTLGCVLVAARKRSRLPEEEQFSVDPGKLTARIRGLVDSDDVVLNALVVLCVVLAAGTVLVAITVPIQGETFTEFYLLNETENGSLTATDYPSTLEANRNYSFTVGVSNHEDEPTNYTIVVLLQRIGTAGNTTAIIEQERLDQLEMTLPAEETRLSSHQISPTMTGRRLRLVYLLYRGSPPSRPGIENSYRTTNLWVTVTKRGAFITEE